MEHRMYGRLFVSLTAEVYQAGEKLGTFPVKNIGDNGLCIIDPSDCLRKDKYLQVVISPSSPMESLACTMSSLVIWTNKHHVGLMWACGNEKARQFINKVTSITA